MQEMATFGAAAQKKESEEEGEEQEEEEEEQEITRKIGILCFPLSCKT